MTDHYLDGMDQFYPRDQDEPEASCAHQLVEQEWRDWIDTDALVDGYMVTVDLDLAVRYERLIRERTTV